MRRMAMMGLLAAICMSILKACGNRNEANPGAKFAVYPGAYVGAMHDSFPHAPELSRQGYNAFALILAAKNRRYIRSE